LESFRNVAGRRAVQLPSQQQISPKFDWMHQEMVTTQATCKSWTNSTARPILLRGRVAKHRSRSKVKGRFTFARSISRELITLTGE